MDPVSQTIMEENAKNAAKKKAEAEEEQAKRDAEAEKKRIEEDNQQGMISFK